MTDALPDRNTPLTGEEAVAAAADWSDYRENYSPGSSIQAAHQAFIAGWTARRNAVPALNALQKLAELHKPTEEEVLTWACVDGECEHEEAARGEDCPTTTIQVCAYCWGLVSEIDPEHAVPADVNWPCATARALGVQA